MEKERNAGNANRSVPGVTDVQERWITLDGARMRYLLSGSGPPLLLLHGLLGYSFSWRLVTQHLSAKATVYALDMLGAGFSDRPPGLDSSLRGSAERLLRFLDAVRIERVDLLGTSQGGAVSMMAAALAPHRIRRLILVAPVNPWSARGRWLAPFLSCQPVAWLLLALLPALKVGHEALLRRLYADPRKIPPGTLEGYAAALAVPGSFPYALRVLRSWRRDLRELEALLPRTTGIPTLLIWGSEDRAVDPASAQILQEYFRDCRLLIFDGVGHLPYEEAPQEFQRAVAEFLKRTPVHE